MKLLVKPFSSILPFGLAIGLSACGGDSSTPQEPTDPPAAQSFTLSVTKTGGGLIESSPGGISCGDDCTQEYTEDAVVTLTADISAGATIDWQGCDSSPTDTSCEVSLTSNKTIDVTVNSPIWTSIEVNNTHSCGIRSDEQAYCWGWGQFGALGAGDFSDAAVPIGVQNAASINSWTQVSVGQTHSCGLSDSGQIFCWGTGGDGQLGSASARSQVPVPIDNPETVETWTTLSGGNNHTCAIADDNQIYCTGANFSGQLGLGNTNDVSIFTQIANPEGVSGWSDVSAGSTHSCAITNGGQAYCWGFGFFGQLGANSTSSSNVPLAVIRPTGVSEWTEISAGSSHSCAIANDGQAYCWGTTGRGRLGVSDLSQSKLTVPTAVVNPTNVNIWENISAGSAHSCGIGNGQVFCWGSGVSGQLGVEATEDVTVPTSVINPLDVVSWTGVSAGTAHSCGIGSDGQGYCWGGNGRQNGDFITQFGILGTGNTTDNIITIPTPIINP